MIPAKIITFEEAKSKGLTSDKPILSGESVCGAMTIVRNIGNGVDEVMEKYVVKVNKELELKFMHKDRIKHLKKKDGNFEKYMNQFKIINGVERDKYINNNNLIKEDKDIKE